MKTEEEIRKQIKASEKQLKTSITYHADVFYGGYQAALNWVLSN